MGADTNKTAAMKGSLIIVSFFIIGVVVGRAGLTLPTPGSIDVSFITLALLIFCVGVSIGSDMGILRELRGLDRRLMLLPAATIAGTLAGCLILSLFLRQRSPADVLAVGSGFGYYSLSSIFVTRYKGAELGTIALLSNVAREMITLLGAPLLVKLAGPLAPISSGGATSMDTTLPVITATSGKEFAILSIYHGFIVDLSVPFLVTLFCGLG